MLASMTKGKGTGEAASRHSHWVNEWMSRDRVQEDLLLRLQLLNKFSQEEERERNAALRSRTDGVREWLKATQGAVSAHSDEDSPWQPPIFLEDHGDGDTRHLFDSLPLSASADSSALPFTTDVRSLPPNLQQHLEATSRSPYDPPHTNSRAQMLYAIVFACAPPYSPSHTFPRCPSPAACPDSPLPLAASNQPCHRPGIASQPNPAPLAPSLPLPPRHRAELRSSSLPITRSSYTSTARWRFTRVWSASPKLFFQARNPRAPQVCETCPQNGFKSFVCGGFSPPSTGGAVFRPQPLPGAPSGTWGSFTAPACSNPPSGSGGDGGARPGGLRPKHHRGPV